MLMIQQVAALYCSTGTVKNGTVWASGDAFYYALNLDHFYRFEPQQLSAIFGTNLFRINTWVVHWWEAFFPLVVLGLVSRFMRREKFAPLPTWQRWTVRACWLMFGLTACCIVVITLPVHIPAKKTGAAWSLAEWQRWFPVLWISGMAVVAGLVALGKRRPQLLDWICTWLFGRRIWLSLGIIFHAHLIVMMNIGWFTPATLSTYFVFLNGNELAHLLRRIGARLARMRVPMPASVRSGEPPLPTEDATLPHLHRDAAAIPRWALGAALVIAVAGVYVAVMRIGEGPRPAVIWGGAGGLLFLGLAATAIVMARRRGAEQLPLIDPNTNRPRPPWAHATLGRFLAGTLCVYHITGVAIWLLPEKDCLGGAGTNSWRVVAQDPFKWWMRITQTNQGWKMFAPNPPRSNLMMRVLVTDKDGEVYDLNTDVYHPANRPIPWLFYTRIRKINRRIIGAEGGKGEWYQKWHARYICRQWALDHGGEAPAQVDLVKVSYAIPTPEDVAKHGPYDPVQRMAGNVNSKHQHTTKCEDIGAQLPNFIRARHGLPLLPEGEFKAWNKHRLDAWNKKLATLAKRGRDPNRVPLVPLALIAAAVIVGLRWRRLDRDNKIAATSTSSS
jgi:hypothetical protein